MGIRRREVLTLKKKCYKPYNLLDLSRLTKFSHLHPKRRARVAFKTLRGACHNHKVVI